MDEKSFNFITDMADERVDIYKRVHNLSDIDGIEVISEKDEEINITTVNVLNKNGAEAVSKDIGKYITVQISEIKYLDEKDKKKLIDKLSFNIKELIGEDKKKSILIVGLGNLYVTPDALGPKVIQNLEITRHILNFAKELVEENTRSVSAISPGVLGTTGIETFEIVEAIVNKTKPDMLIVIDSLVSQSVKRVGNTIQLSNTGITPGAGVRNKRESINEEKLKIPVIAIGVPTVVDMATLTNETVDKIIESEKNKLNELPSKQNKDERLKLLNMLEDNTRYDMIAKVLDTQNYIVTLKEVDDLINTMSDIISSGINMAM